MILRKCFAIFCILFVVFQSVVIHTKSDECPDELFLLIGLTISTALFAVEFALYAFTTCIETTVMCTITFIPGLMFNIMLWFRVANCTPIFKIIVGLTFVTIILGAYGHKDIDKEARERNERKEQIERIKRYVQIAQNRSETRDAIHAELERNFQNARNARPEQQIVNYFIEDNFDIQQPDEGIELGEV